MIKSFKKILMLFLALFSLIAFTSCGEKENSKVKQAETASISESEASSEEESGQEEGSPALQHSESSTTDEEQAKNAVNEYVKAAKILDFKTMSNYISDSEKLPILESYTKAYAKYSVDESRIKELCRARLGTYEITPVSAEKNTGGVMVGVKIKMVNMESLQNKWMETLCDKYPEYTTLSEEEMTPEAVDVLIQVMIDVLKEAEPSVEMQKDFQLISQGGRWIINAKNEDFFPSN